MTAAAASESRHHNRSHDVTCPWSPDHVLCTRYILAAMDTDSIRTGSTDESPSFSGRIIAHRGRSAGGPENVIAGLPELPPWIAGVEVDVRLTSDGVPVLMHDATVDRTTGGTGEVAELTAEQFTSLAGQEGAPLVTLEEYLAACAGRGFSEILIDIKAPSPELFEAVGPIVADSEVADACTLLVRKPDPLLALRRMIPRQRLGMYQTSVKNVDDRLDLAAAMNVDLLMVKHGDHRYLKHRGAISRIRADGVRAGASTVNSPEVLEAAVADGCDVILTDNSETLGGLFTE